MNEEQRTIAELKKRNAELEERVSAFENPTPQSALILGRAVHPQTPTGSGLIAFWSGKKKKCRLFP